MYWPKPPFQHVPFSIEDFDGYASGMIIDRSKGEWDEPDIYIASCLSNDEVFLGLRIYVIGYDIHNFSLDETVRMKTEAFAFLKKGNFELSELKLLANYNPNSHEEVYPLSNVRKYNLNIAYHDHSPFAQKPLIILSGVGHNETGFEADDPLYRLRDINVDHELFLILTLSYSSGLFIKKHETVSTSIYIAVKGVFTQ